MVGVLGLLVLGVLLAGWMASGAEREFRADQLQQTRMLAQALNLERVKVLTGTPADLVRPEYAQLREQLGAARAVLPNCKFISVVTRRPEGSVVYLVDSEPAGSSTARLPGQ